MNNAKTIIEKFGGQTALAKLIGKGQSTVQYWARSGRIPAKWQPILLKVAQQNAISLSAKDFIDTENEKHTSSEKLPVATHWGELQIGDKELPCYVLDDGERVFSLKGVVVGLIEIEGGQLAEYIKVRSLKDYLPQELTPDQNGAIPCLIRFDTTGHEFAKYAWGLPVEKFMDLCVAYSTAAEAAEREEGKRQTNPYSNSLREEI